MDNNEKNDDNKKSLLEKVLFWLKINALLSFCILITFWIFITNL